MGFYRCYLCNKEFWTNRGLTKHYENNKCPKDTKRIKNGD